MRYFWLPIKAIMERLRRSSYIEAAAVAEIVEIAKTVLSCGSNVRRDLRRFGNGAMTGERIL
jgi:hypothetical protein